MAKHVNDIKGNEKLGLVDEEFWEVIAGIFVAFTSDGRKGGCGQ